MRVFISFLFLFIMIVGCKQKPKKGSVTDKIEVKKQINLLIDNWHKSAANANFETYFESMSSNSVFVGTDASEVWDVAAFKDFSKPYFDKGKAWNFKPLERNIYLNTGANIAWFDEVLKTWMGVCRGSGVVKKHDTIWKIEHYVLSLTIPNDNVQEVIKINKKKDSLFVRKYAN